MRTTTLIPSLVTLAAMLGCAASSVAQDSPRGGLVVRAESAEPMIVVSATGMVEVAPDEARVLVSVVTEAKTAEEAVRENNRRTGTVVDALNRVGLGDRAVTTAGFQVSPRYNFDPKTGRQLGILGYTVTNTVEVKTGRLELTGKAIEEAINAGANQILSLQFGLKDSSEARMGAVADAVTKARADARTVAMISNLELGAPRRVTVERDFARPFLAKDMVAMRAASMEMDGAGQPPVNPGLITVTANVTIEYSFTTR